jgi:hypothetical protein
MTTVSTPPPAAGAPGSASAHPGSSGRCVAFRGRDIPVVLPKLRDPRLKLSGIILTLTLLGQSILNFKVSMAQILLSILLCALIETSVTLWQENVLLWPASAIQTGVSVTFILRAAGTPHGDLWTLNGIWYFVLAVMLSLGSKYFIRLGGRHVFNPSNFGIVWCLLLLGANRVFSEHLWWAPFGLRMALTMTVIVGGAAWLLRQVRMIPMALAFLGTFALLIGIFAICGREFTAIWHDGPITGAYYWVNISLSPELLIFVFFMITDPQTSPKSARGRIIFGAGTAVVAAVLILPQSTEFAIKVAILASLTVTCAVVGIVERVAEARQAQPESRPVQGSARLFSVWRPVTLLAVLIVAVAAPINTLRLRSDKQIILIERGLAGPNAQ